MNTSVKIIPKTTAWAILAFVFMSTLFISGSANAQLSRSQLDQLQKRAQAEDWTFEIGENPATQQSLDNLCGLKEPENWRENASFDPCTPKRELPEYFDWRDSGYCTPIRNQSSCGSCWAFGSVGPLESNILRVDGLEVDLSEQWLVSCNSEGWGCDGGWFAHDYHQFKTDPCGGTGAVYESDFPYTATDEACNCPYEHHFTIDSWSYIGGSSTVPAPDAIKQAILDHGPVSVAVIVTSAMQGYSGGVFNAPATGSVNHAVVLVGWDDSQGTNGVWFMRNSWGTGWGEDGYMRIEYGVADIGYGACYVEYSGVDKLAIEYVSEPPEFVIPGEQHSFQVSVEGIYGGQPMSQSGTLHYSINGEAYQTSAMTEIEANLYEAKLPALECYDFIDYYVSAVEASGDTIYSPVGMNPYSAVATTEVVDVFSDDFETDQGWVVTGNAVDGQWNRGIPVNYGRGDPVSDYDGSGQCYLTDNYAGNSDVDDGSTILTSPIFDLSESEAIIKYARWYSNSYGADPYNDQMQVYVSNDAGQNWVLVENIGPVEQSSGGWYTNTFWVSDLVTPSSQMQLRFNASDLSSGSVVEAAVDAVEVKTLLCGPQYVCGDVNADEIVDVSDAVYIVNFAFAGGPAPDPIEAGDVTCDLTVDVSDAVFIINFAFSSGFMPCDTDGDGEPDC
jgi:C1A family cysteine protease